MSLPTRFIAGDSLYFLVTNANYLAVDGWSLRYILINASTKIVLNSVGEGGSHRFTAATNVTSAWVAGEYAVGLYAVRNDERVTLDQSSIIISPDPIASATIDGRSNAKKTLDALMVAYDEMIASGGLAQMVSMNGRVMQFSTADQIIAQINFFQRQVNSEDQAKNLSKGCGLGGRILTRLA